MTAPPLLLEAPGSVGVYRFPTPGPETDGTFAWTSTVAVTVSLSAGGVTGLGWTYSTPAAAAIIEHELLPILAGRSPWDIAQCRSELRRACRDIGTTGVVAHALSAIDIALWDLKARLLDSPLTRLLGTVRLATPVYGSGGFTNLPDDELADQILGWLSAGCTAVKIKIGRDIARDLDRLILATELVTGRAELMVDADGAYSVGAARRWGAALDELGVTWFEEPVPSADRAGLAAVRDSVECDVTAGEYICEPFGAAALLGAVDCLQLNVTRCGGYSGFLEGAALAAAHGLDVSAHGAPALHAPIAAAVPNLRHAEWYVDHARLEPLLVEGVPEVVDGLLPHSGKLGAAADDIVGHGMSLAVSATEFRL
ncbi:enolase C-terminal domain-like protein [Nocardia sp. alder85J]|uniref:enolase C-terminal domain-like protein n=1 Tax=Nocardia sp. alder85J TaxID=2862949 RepID=UPI001CD732E1|nr:enolase C-terminal domain-like protein [Nocardia sp. alder85J]MCX4092982.1 mandelate racemase [Nocardia sp. alder85J]